ncbi:MAG: bacterial proteasome activator family protein [Actinobacteria bacterium]|nr:MAG: bacterial proteasome activator family protein [Actinomycetota bacterium]
MAPDRPEAPPNVVVVPPGAVGTRPSAEADEAPAGGGSVEPTETVAQPARVMRIGSMIRQLLEEVRQAPLDEKSRTRLREIYDTSIHELSDGLSPDLAAELDRISSPFDGGTPSEGELRVAQAQLVGWLEGLFQGIQATLFAQQMNARSQLEEMRRRQLPSGEDAQSPRPGTYL